MADGYARTSAARRIQRVLEAPLFERASRGAANSPADLDERSMVFLSALRDDDWDDGELPREDPRTVDDDVSSSNAVSQMLDSLDRHSESRHWWVGRSGAPRPSLLRVPGLHVPLLDGKPSDSCLFTSGGNDEWRGMWSLQGPVEYPNGTTHRTWALVPESGFRELRIQSAVDWCETAVQYRMEGQFGLVLDWHRIALEFDCLTVTARGVFSVDGISFEWRGDHISAPHWTVRTTVWFRWVFREVQGGGERRPTTPPV